MRIDIEAANDDLRAMDQDKIRFESELKRIEQVAEQSVNGRKNAEETIARFEKRLSDIRAAAEKAGAELARLCQEISAAEEKSGEDKRIMDELKSRRDSLSSKMSDMKIKKTALEKDLEAVKESIKALEEQSRSIGDSSVKSAMAIEEQNRIIAEKNELIAKREKALESSDVSTRYTRRSRSEYERIAGYINAVVTQKTGNYMVFFPSYKMMNDVADIYCEKYADETELMLQKNNMSETEREEFLDRFSEETDRTLVAFGIMGGIFGEGIDLKNDRLIGAIVVGTGLPQISNERTILKDYYDAENGCGFDYAFRYPGINKVLQAAGRVIRTTEDTGVILLLDERFWQREYDLLYPREWSDRKPCNIANVGKLVADFWEQI